MRILSLLFILTLSACSVVNPFVSHKVPIQQGNYITADAVAKLKPGMNKDQVRFLLGTPLLKDAFHKARWDYLYRDIEKGKLVQRSDKTLTLYFNGDILTQIEGQGQPDAAHPQDASAPMVESAAKP